MIIMDILIKLLAIKSEANNILGCSMRSIILLYAGCCFDFKTLMSLKVKEKKATSEPASTKDKNNSTTNISTKTVVPWG